MRIAFLSPSAQLGGAERVLLHALHSLSVAKPAGKWGVVLPEDGPLAGAVAQAGAAVHFVPMPASLSRTGESHLRGPTAWWGLSRQAARALPAAGGYVIRLRRALRRLGPDLIHSNGIKTHLLAAAAAPHGTPVVWHAHDFYGARAVTRRLLKIAARRCCGVVAISQAVAADIRSALPGSPVVVVANAIDVTEFTPEGPAADLDQLSGLPPTPPGTLRIGLVAAYALWKGHDAFLNAAARFVAELPELPVRFYIVGGPIYRTQAQWSEAELRATVERLGLVSRVGFVPFQARPADAYRGLDVVVHASTAPEPFGLTIAEAMACGRAVVVSAGGGAAELFTQGQDAVGVPPGDIDALAAALRSLALDAPFRERLGRSARATAILTFDRSRLGPELLAAYTGFSRPRAGRHPSTLSATMRRST